MSFHPLIVVLNFGSVFDSVSYCVLIVFCMYGVLR